MRLPQVQLQSPRLDFTGLTLYAPKCPEVGVYLVMGLLWNQYNRNSFAHGSTSIGSEAEDIHIRYKYSWTAKGLRFCQRGLDRNVTMEFKLI